MKRWENIIKRANYAYTEREYPEALSLNRFAILVAQKNFEHSFETSDPEKAIASIIVGHLNMMDVFDATDNFSAAKYIFEEGVLFFKKVMPKSRSKQQKDAILRGASHLKKEWHLFSKKYNEKTLNEKAPSFSLLQSKAAHLLTNHLTVH